MKFLGQSVELIDWQTKTTENIAWTGPHMIEVLDEHTYWNTLFVHQICPSLFFYECDYIELNISISGMAGGFNRETIVLPASAKTDTTKLALDIGVCYSIWKIYHFFMFCLWFHYWLALERTIIIWIEPVSTPLSWVDVI